MTLPKYRLEYKEAASFLGKAIENYCIFFFFFICYLATLQPSLGHYRSNSLSYLMLITVYS